MFDQPNLTQLSLNCSSHTPCHAQLTPKKAKPHHPPSFVFLKSDARSLAQKETQKAEEEAKRAAREKAAAQAAREKVCLVLCVKEKI